MRILMIVTSVISYFLNSALSRAKFGHLKDFNLEAPLTLLVWITSIVSIGVTFGASKWLLGDSSQSGLWWVLSTIISCGTLAGAIIPEFTKVFVSTHSRHVQEVTTSSHHGGASLNILSGFVAGNFSAFWKGLVILTLMFIAYKVSQHASVVALMHPAPNFAAPSPSLCRRAGQGSGNNTRLMIGPPGSGKTMLARRLPTILPKIGLDEALETTKIHSVAGVLPLGESLVARRPFRAPHHTISDAGLIGGGSYPRPGEVSLAHGGVLFLDELPEFRKNVLEVLRQPMEDGVVTIARAAMSLTYPARFMLAAAMNPCPCGYFGDPQHNCVCGPLGVERYLARVSGPLLDRIDIHLEVPAVKYRALADQGAAEASEAIRERVDRARALQRDRFAKRPGVYANAHMAARDIRTFCRVSDGADALLRTAITRLALSARAYHRILKIARTIADLSGGADLAPAHVSEAIQYRSLDRRGLG